MFKTKQKCLHCGNNPTNHKLAYIFQTLSVLVTPLVIVVSFFENKITFSIAKIIMTPYLHVFKFLRLLKFNRDISKAKTDRSRVVWEEAFARNIPMEQFVIFNKPIEQYRAKFQNKWFYFESLPIPPSMYSRNYAWMDDKEMLKNTLREKKIATPRGKSVKTQKEALEIFEKLGASVITKPRLGSRGRHTTTHINKKSELIDGFKIASELCQFVIVEEHLSGSVYRGTYVGGEIVGILRGDPPRITGDGKSTIKELIERKNLEKNPKTKDVVVDKKLEDFLNRIAYTSETVLEKGKTIDLSEKIGLSYGGHSKEMLKDTHPKIIDQLKRAGDTLKAPVVGFDFIIDDPTSDPEGKSWGIIEANSLPFINLHHDPLEGEPQNVAGKVWDLWKSY